MIRFAKYMAALAALAATALHAAAQHPEYQVTDRARAAYERMTRETFRVKAGDKVPSFAVRMLDGSEVRIDSLRGKTVLINFWGTRCPPCNAELARVVDELLSAFRGKAFVFLPIECSDSPEAVGEWLAAKGYGFATGLDRQRAVFNLFCGPGIPRNILVGPDGKIVLVEAGYIPEKFAEMMKTIEKTIGKQ